MKTRRNDRWYVSVGLQDPSTLLLSLKERDLVQARPVGGSSRVPLLLHQDLGRVHHPSIHLVSSLTPQRSLFRVCDKYIGNIVT